MFPLGITMSLPCTRPMTTSSLSNDSALVSPPFSVIVSLIMGPRTRTLGQPTRPGQELLSHDPSFVTEVSVGAPSAGGAGAAGDTPPSGAEAAPGGGGDGCFGAERGGDEGW